MTVNNKYKIGEKVYFINTEKKAMCDEVKAIYIYVYKDYTSVVYSLKESLETVKEEDAFLTESDLKDYVFKDLIDFV
jgi:hypothetical protein